MLTWSSLIFFQVQYLPMINLVGRVSTLAFLIVFAATWVRGIATGRNVVVVYTILVASYGAILLGSSAFNGHNFIFRSRATFFGFSYHFVIFLAGMIFAQMRAYPRPPPQQWFLSAVGAVFFVLSLNFYNFAAGSFVSSESRTMIYEGVNSISLGYLAGLMGTAFFALSIRLKHWFHRVIFGLCAFVMLLSLVAVAARGAFLYFVLTALFMSFLTFRFSIAFYKSLMTFVVVAGIGTAGLMAVKSEFLIMRWEYLMDRFMPTVDYFRGYHDAGAQDATAGRSEIYGHYLEQFSSWWLKGLSGYSGAYPHNFFLEVGVRFGLLGIPILIVWFLVVKKVFIISLYRERVDPFDATVVAIFVFTVLQSMTSMSLEMFRAMWASMGYLLILKVSRVPKGIRM